MSKTRTYRVAVPAHLFFNVRATSVTEAKEEAREAIKGVGPDYGVDAMLTALDEGRFYPAWDEIVDNHAPITIENVED